jgi:hypothetical protein
MWSRQMLFTGNLLGILFDLEAGGSKFLRNVGELPDYTASEPEDRIIQL